MYLKGIQSIAHFTAVYLISLDGQTVTLSQPAAN